MKPKCLRWLGQNRYADLNTIARNFAHLISLGWVWIATYIALGFIETKSSGWIPKGPRSMYAVVTVLNFGLCQYVLVEWISRLGPKIWRGPDNHMVAKELGYALLGLLISLGLQHTVVYVHADTYAAPIINFFDYYPLRKPGVVQTNLFFIAVWSIAILGRLFITLKIGEREMMHGNVSPGVGRGHTPSMPIPFETGAVDTRDDGVLHISIGKKTERLKWREISHVTVEGHYCRFYLQKEGAVQQRYVHISLKRVLKQLPPHKFVRIHRSHVVNTSFVKGLKKRGRSYRVALIDELTSLPVSRHRFEQIKGWLL